MSQTTLISRARKIAGGTAGLLVVSLAQAADSASLSFDSPGTFSVSKRDVGNCDAIGTSGGAYSGFGGGFSGSGGSFDDEYSVFSTTGGPLAETPTPGKRSSTFTGASRTGFQVNPNCRADFQLNVLEYNFFNAGTLDARAGDTLTLSIDFTMSVEDLSPAEVFPDNAFVNKVGYAVGVNSVLGSPAYLESFDEAGISGPTFETRFSDTRSLLLPSDIENEEIALSVWAYVVFDRGRDGVLNFGTEGNGLQLSVSSPAAAVPLPSTMFLLFGGLAGLSVAGRKTRRRSGDRT